MERAQLLERKRREDAERKRQEEEMDRILEENRRKVGWALNRRCRLHVGATEHSVTLPACTWKANVFSAHRPPFGPRLFQVEEAQRKAAEAAAEQQGLARPGGPPPPARRKQVGHAVWEQGSGLVGY